MKELNIKFGRGSGMVFKKRPKELEVTWDLVREKETIFQHNKLKIIDAALGIESKLESLISVYFFGWQIHEDVRQDEFENLILNSSWLTFGIKHRLVITTLKKLEFLSKKDLDLLNSLLFKVTGYRNAFTHGKLIIDTPFCFLSHFDKDSVETELCDKFFDKVEKRFHDCNEILYFLQCRVGKTLGDYTIKPNQPSPPAPKCLEGNYDDLGFKFSIKKTE